MRSRAARSHRRVLTALAAVLAGGCGDREPVGGAPPEADPTLSEPVQIVPSAGIPAALPIQAANNNLDVVRHEGRLFLAWRTAPWHFAAPETRLLVASTTDETTFRAEGQVHLGTDLREPRLLSFAGQLYLYFAVLGKDPLDFEPGGTKVLRWLGEGVLSEPEDADLPAGFIAWRTKVEDGVATMIGYRGGEEVYDFTGAPAIEVHWLVSEDGLAWTPAVPGMPVVHTGGASETDLVVTEDGTVVFVMRNEAGEPGGFGSLVCRAEAAAPGDLDCVHDPRKFDSPLLFEHSGGIWLLARRHLTGDGRFDLGRTDLPPDERARTYQLAYWDKPKRCTLWRVDAEALTVEPAADLASRGDTCFPAVAPLEDGSVAVYDYSSPLEGPDLPWIEGQQGETRIYRQILSF